MTTTRGVAIQSLDGYGAVEVSYPKDGWVEVDFEGVTTRFTGKKACFVDGQIYIDDIKVTNPDKRFLLAFISKTKQPVPRNYYAEAMLEVEESNQDLQLALERIRNRHNPTIKLTKLALQLKKEGFSTPQQGEAQSIAKAAQNQSGLFKSLVLPQKQGSSSKSAKVSAEEFTIHENFKGHGPITIKHLTNRIDITFAKVKTSFKGNEVKFDGVNLFIDNQMVTPSNDPFIASRVPGCASSGFNHFFAIITDINTNGAKETPEKRTNRFIKWMRENPDFEQSPSNSDKATGQSSLKFFNTPVTITCGNFQEVTVVQTLTPPQNQG